MNRSQIVRWLRETDGRRLEELWRRADAARRTSVGDEVHLRGLLEISNVCARDCLYCGLRASNRDLPRYRMTADEILGGARRAAACGCGTVVLQSGEDYGIETGVARGGRLPHQGRDAAGGDPEPRRAARRRPGGVARGRGRPVPPAVRDLQPGPV